MKQHLAQFADKPDIAHLSFLPPFTPGSYNRSVGKIVQFLPDFQQMVISFWEKPAPSRLDEHILLVSSNGLSITQRLFLILPQSVRKLFNNGIAGSESLIYLWQTIRSIKRYKPSIIVCHDNYKMGLLLKRQIDWPCRLVLCQHGLSYYLSLPESSKLYSLRSFDVIWTLAQVTYTFEQTRIHAYESEVVVISNAVDTELFHPVSKQEQFEIRKKWDLPEGAPIVLLLGRLVPKKGAHIIINAWQDVIKAVPTALLWIVGGGDDDYSGYLISLAEALDISETVRFQGSISSDQVNMCYQASDIFAFPTLCSEGHSLALLEAMASGLPCVASDHKIARELYTEDEVLFVPVPNLSKAFVTPLINLLQNPSEAQRFGNAGRQAVLDRFSYKEYFKKLHVFFSQQLRTVRG